MRAFATCALLVCVQFSAQADITTSAPYVAARAALKAARASPELEAWTSALDAIWSFYGFAPESEMAISLLYAVNADALGRSGPMSDADKKEFARRFGSRLDTALVLHRFNDRIWTDLVELEMDQEFGRSRKAEVPDLDRIRAKIAAVRSRMPTHASIPGWELSLVLLLEKMDPVTAAKQLQEIADGNGSQARKARGILNLRATFQQPLELRFTALDNREIDLAKLRGKVVLLDFWAMWCAPCLRELPNLKKVYATYHKQGFEIVGISHDRDRDKLVKFITQNQLPWPQYFDGKGSGNDVAGTYGITAVPTQILVDQSGRTVTTEARYEKLEQEVRRLLGLPP